MKALFREIRAGDLNAVRRRLDKQPALVAVTAKAPPKKDDGQSPLQVAIKSGSKNAFAVANALLDYGADVSFRETSEINEWTAPVLHDGVRAAVFSSRGVADNGAALSDAGFALLRRLLDMGAEVNGLDSYGNDAITRFALDARQVWIPRNDQEVLRPDLRRIADLLFEHDADPSRIHPRRQQSLLHLFAEDPVIEFLAP